MALPLHLIESQHVAATVSELSLDSAAPPRLVARRTKRKLASNVEDVRGSGSEPSSVVIIGQRRDTPTPPGAHTRGLLMGVGDCLARCHPLGLVQSAGELTRPANKINCQRTLGKLPRASNLSNQNGNTVLAGGMTCSLRPYVCEEI